MRPGRRAGAARGGGWRLMAACLAVVQSPAGWLDIGWLHAACWLGGGGARERGGPRPINDHCSTPDKIRCSSTAVPPGAQQRRAARCYDGVVDACLIEGRKKSRRGARPCSRRAAGVLAAPATTKAHRQQECTAWLLLLRAGSGAATAAAAVGQPSCACLPLERPASIRRAASPGAHKSSLFRFALPPAAPSFPPPPPPLPPAKNLDSTAFTRALPGLPGCARRAHAAPSATRLSSHALPSALVERKRSICEKERSRRTMRGRISRAVISE